jgi:hypothetical protein
MPTPKRHAGEALPPHSLEAERGVLGCILLEPSCMADCAALKPSFFYDIRNQLIFAAAERLFLTRKPVEIISLQQQLGSKLRDAGGLGYISKLSDDVPSASHLAYYLGILTEKYQLRRIVQGCTEVARRIQDHQGPAEDLFLSVNSDLSAMLEDQRPAAHQEHWAVHELYDFDVANDPSAVIGVRPDKKFSRYLCKQGRMWIIGPTGAGKSSLVVQMASLWSMGEPFCGVAPVRPLRVLYVQAENDKGDSAEEVQGFANSMKLIFTERMELWNTNFKLLPQAERVGVDFIRWLEAEILAHQADIACIDPLLSYLDIDIMRQEACSRFLNCVVQPVLRRTGCVFIGVHHTSKTRPQNPKYQASDSASSYEGLGSSVLANWARATMTLSCVDDINFKLVLGKRGNRAMATHPDGQPASTLWLQHGRTDIFWRQVAPPEQAAQGEKAKKQTLTEKVASMNTASFIAGCPKGGEGFREIARRLMDWAMKEHRIRLPKTTSERCIDALLSSRKLDYSDGKYTPGPNK